MSVASGKKSRRKGAAFEVAVANACTEAFGVDCKRSYGQSRHGGDAPDVAIPNLWVELKHYAKPYDIELALDQAIKDTPPSLLPVAICKWTRHSTVVAWSFPRRDWCDGARHTFAVPNWNIAQAAAWELKDEVMVVGEICIANFDLWLSCPFVKKTVAGE